MASFARYAVFSLSADIPFFKEVVIMATHCDECGYKTNDVKSGGAIAPRGRRIILQLTDSEDMSRDVLKVRLLLICGLEEGEGVLF